MRKIIVNQKIIDIFSSLECGQTFRFVKHSDSFYSAYSLDKKVEITKEADQFILVSDDIDYFEEFFAINDDYETIFNVLKKMPILKDSLNDDTKRLRILKQDPFEMIISFIISANNNIPRIKGIIEKLCENLGEKKEGYFAFPTVEKLAAQSESFYKSMGLGYRAPYILKTSQMIKNNIIDVNKLKWLDTNAAKQELLKLPGVGPKVADCILLFGYNKMDVFPVDTWIKKVYYDIFKEEANASKMREKLLITFAPYQGIAQQYLFVAKRDNN